MLATWLIGVFAVIAAWFVATGAVLWLDRRPVETYGVSLMAATALAGVATAVILVTAEMGGAGAAWAGFFAALVVWGWHEISFLMGLVTGPRRLPCPPGARGWKRFRFATAVLIHHEIALAATALLLFMITWGQPNQVAPLTFLLLFVMRLSTKLNIFLGVPHMVTDMLPAHLDYMKSYFGPKTGRNVLMPVSLLLVAGLAVALAAGAVAAAPGSAQSATLVILFTLTLLALVEHLFLILPFRESAMWGWAMNQRH
ncbi:MAG: putative photosynthetic complex assembly protein PuhE [Thermaurantiacus sp.]